MYETILTEVSSGVGTITLNRPERHNALDGVMVRELRSALAATEEAREGIAAFPQKRQPNWVATLGGD